MYIYIPYIHYLHMQSVLSIKGQPLKILGYVSIMHTITYIFVIVSCRILALINNLCGIGKGILNQLSVIKYEVQY